MAPPSSRFRTPILHPPSQAFRVSHLVADFAQIQNFSRPSRTPALHFSTVSISRPLTRLLVTLYKKLSLHVVPEGLGKVRAELGWARRCLRPLLEFLKPSNLFMFDLCRPPVLPFGLWRPGVESRLYLSRLVLPNFSRAFRRSFRIVCGTSGCRVASSWGVSRCWESRKVPKSRWEKIEVLCSGLWSPLAAKPLEVRR